MQCCFPVVIVSAKKQHLQPTDDSSQFVVITDVVPDAILEIRYFGTYNFVGARIDGYHEPIALMTRVAADSLKAVSNDVKGLGYRRNRISLTMKGVTQ